MSEACISIYECVSEPEYSVPGPYLLSHCRSIAITSSTSSAVITSPARICFSDSITLSISLSVALFSLSHACMRCDISSLELYFSLHISRLSERISCAGLLYDTWFLLCIRGLAATAVFPIITCVPSDNVAISVVLSKLMQR